MSVEQNKAVVRQVLEELWNQNFAVADEHPGIQESIPFVQQLSLAFADPVFSLQEQFGEGEWVATRFLTESTHVGEFMGMQPTGERVLSETILLNRLVDSVIVEQHSQGGRIG